MCNSTGGGTGTVASLSALFYVCMLYGMHARAPFGCGNCFHMLQNQLILSCIVLLFLIVCSFTISVTVFFKYFEA